mmetsp:Transcript_10783/g.33020  ORF Transcript_10783/g.33020 Transcript_10783/m.33020 type:complete len:500 (+) Transcript_10783:142-1641(+)
MEDAIFRNYSRRGSFVMTTEKAEATRKTSIVCTIGPATDTEEKLYDLLEAGMDVLRLNFSHGTYPYSEKILSNLENALRRMPGKTCAVALDTKGPEIRTGRLEGGVDVIIQSGSRVIVTGDDAYSEKSRSDLIYCDYKALPQTVKTGMKIYVDDGLLCLDVEEVKKDHVICRAANTAPLGNKKGMNLPGAIVKLPAVSEKDRADLEWGAQNNIDFVFASFIRRASQVQDVRKALGSKGKNVKIISKIENQEGLDNIGEILEVTDGIMVARGDLGIEIPACKVFTAQKVLIRKCNIAGKPVICATQMLESMVTNPRPTRAEVSDVGNAILDGADCVMLSGETAKGKYPLEAVKHMDEVASESETYVDNEHVMERLRSRTKRPMSNQESISLSAVVMSFEQGFDMIVVVCEGWSDTHRLVSKYRPKVPVFCVTDNPMIARQSLMHRGCIPIQVPDFKSVDYLLNLACEAGKASGICAQGSKVIAIFGSDHESTTLKVVNVE